MAKVKVQDWDETASGNTDINSISIAEGMAPSDVNNAKREEMSQVRKWNLYRGHISGIVPAIDSDTAHDINFPVGEAADSTNVQMIHVDTALVKQIDVNWAAGTGAGGFPSGLTLSADTWYHLFVIGQTDGTVDAGFDTSLTASFLLTDAVGYTLYRRVGSILTDSSSNLTAFSSIEYPGGGLWVDWDDPPLDVDTTTGTSSSTHTISVPTGVQVVARLNTYNQGASGNGPSVYIRPLTADDEAASSTAAPLHTAQTGVAAGAVSSQVSVLTNTSAQFGARSIVANNTFRVATLGWIDLR